MISKFVLHFNGEIYNQELRDEFNTSYDINWKTDHSDTEEILYAYKYWGIDCIKKFKVCLPLLFGIIVNQTFI